MAVPTDVTVTRQVLAEPDAHARPTAPGRRSPTARRWSPRSRRGKGLIVLFHVTADTRWSDLPLSGAFVDMLKRIVGLAGSTAATEGEAASGRAARDEVVPPTRMLDGFGVFGPPPPTARPVPAGFTGAPRPIIRPASTDRRKDCSPSTRSRQPTGSRRSICPRSMRASRPTG